MGPHYNPTSLKASTLASPEHRYIYSLLSHTLIECGDNTNVTSMIDVYYLYSIVKRIPIHLEHMLAWFIKHQAQDPCVVVIFVSPFITWLVHSLGLLSSAKYMKIMGDMIPILIETLQEIGIITKKNTAQRPRYILFRASQFDLDSNEDGHALIPPSSKALTSPLTTLIVLSCLSEQLQDLLD